MRVIPATCLNRRERKKEETRQRIIAAGMKLFREKGFHSTTMEQVADLVDISKVTIYNYFPVKEAIVSDYMQEGYRKIKGQEIPRLIREVPDTRSRLMELFRLSHEWMKANGELYNVYFGYRMQNLLESFRDQSKRSGFERGITLIIAAGQEAGEIRKDITAEVLARHVEMMSGAAFMQWWADPPSFSFEQSLSPTIEIFLNGAKKDYETQKAS